MRRTLVLSVVAGVLIAGIQLVLGNGWGVAIVSGVIAFLVALLALAVANRYGRRD